MSTTLKKRIAHLFLVRDNLNHPSLWQKYFSGNGDYYSIYVHAKWPRRIKQSFIRDRLIARHCETEYARFSLVTAELMLLEAALQDNRNCFFLLHSESCVPVRSFEAVYRELFRIDKSWINYVKGSMSRYGLVDMSAISSNNFYKSSQFFCLTRNHAELILNKLESKHWIHSFCSDEHYIATTLSMHGHLGECFRCDLTFADWKHGGCSPATFHSMKQSDISILQNCGQLFARKFAPSSNIAKFLPLKYRRPVITCNQSLDILSSETRIQWAAGREMYVSPAAGPGRRHSEHEPPGQLP